jgi:hypothetical protein
VESKSIRSLGGVRGREKGGRRKEGEGGVCIAESWVQNEVRKSPE